MSAGGSFWLGLGWGAVAVAFVAVLWHRHVVAQWADVVDQQQDALDAWEQRYAALEVEVEDMVYPTAVYDWQQEQRRER